MQTYIIKSEHDMFYTGPMRGMWSNDEAKADRLDDLAITRQIARRYANWDCTIEIIEERRFPDGTIGHMWIEDVNGDSKA